MMEKLGLGTLRDVLFHFPRDYQDLTNLDSLDALEDGAIIRLRGKVVEIDRRVTSSGGSMVGVLVRAGDGGHIRALWFNQPHVTKWFNAGQDVLLSGKVRQNGLSWEMPHPSIENIESEPDEPPAAMLPVYPLTEGLHQTAMRKIVRAALEIGLPALDEVFPAEFLEAHDLWTLEEALPQIHFPRDRESLDRARRRFAYQELLVLQLALFIRRSQHRDQAQAPPLPTTAKIDARIRRLFPYELTPGQEQAITEIAADMALPRSMHRLLQGDVGSGKTAVAVYAMLLTVAHGYQAVLMAPTEILARQHAATLEQTLAASRVRWVSLTGGLGAARRREILEGIAAGEFDVVIGTQAVIQKDVQFAKLGLLVIDEQHKFGVRQRAQLKQAALAPHYLVMTATPIPRTVAMTLFGDLDVSTLADFPPGRQGVRTYLVHDDQRQRWWEFFRKKLREGRQGYVITPLVDESADIDAASLTAAYESLANGPLEEFRLGLIHGQLSPVERDEAMRSFREGRTQVLISTTVVEVGVDVPNATLMTIEAGERYGLAQLHQLRGRVSRGIHRGVCGVFADPSTDEARRRLEAFVETTDGFRLAETDFSLRGPGELLGTRQHGLPAMRVADLAADAELLAEARRDAEQLVAEDPGLARPGFERLRRMVLARYGRALDLADVG